MVRGVETRLRPLVATAATLMMILSSACPVAASTPGALERVRSAHALEQAHQEDRALRRYMEALSLDPMCEEAYLGLGSLRARRGDLQEAERVYSMALEHLPGLRAARLARAYVKRALGANAEAIEDLLTGAEDDVDALRVLASWHGADGQAPAQLSVWRRIALRARAIHHAALLREAQTMIRALVIFVGTADPAASPPDDGAHGARRTMSVVARRGND